MKITILTDEREESYGSIRVMTIKVKFRLTPPIPLSSIFGRYLEIKRRAPEAQSDTVEKYQMFLIKCISYIKSNPKPEYKNICPFWSQTERWRQASWYRLLTRTGNVRHGLTWPMWTALGVIKILTLLINFNVEDIFSSYLHILHGERSGSPQIETDRWDDQYCDGNIKYLHIKTLSWPECVRSLTV